MIVELTIAKGDKYSVALLDENGEVEVTSTAIIEITDLEPTKVGFMATGENVTDPLKKRWMKLQVFANWIEATLNLGSTKKIRAT